MSSLMSATSSTVVNKQQWKNILVVGGEYPLSTSSNFHERTEDVSVQLACPLLERAPPYVYARAMCD